MRRVKFFFLFLVVLVLVYFIGPQPSTPVYSKAFGAIPSDFNSLDQYVRRNENLHTLKPGNNAEIVWNDSVHKKTEYAIVYLHGFSASREEGNPVHMDIARQFGCNLYLSRLAGHGLDTADAMVNLTADELWESAKEALNIGRQLGNKVILMGTSTGGSLALQLAAIYPDITALLLLSPNIAINDPNAFLLNNPWGLQVARLVRRSKYNQSNNQSPLYKKYWYSQYRLESAVQLEEYLETAMTPLVFHAVKQPVLTLYYYKDQQHQDPVVSVAAIHQMMQELSTPAAYKKEEAIPGAANHVLGSYVVSKDISGVEKAVSRFLEEVLRMKKVT